jgi:hypothetical protein
MTAFDDLKTEVAETKGVAQSAIVLIQGIIAKLVALGDAPTAEQLNAVRDDLKIDTDALAAAVAANQMPGNPAGQQRR